jgi:uncharacterized protein YoxC
LTAFAGTLERVNAQLREYQRNANNVGRLRVNLPTVTTQATGTEPTTQGVATQPTEWQSVSGAIQSYSEALQDATDTISRTVQECSGLAQANKKVKETAEKSVSAFKKFKNAVSESVAPIKKLHSQFLRIAKMRAMRAIIRGIIKGLQEGVQNLAHYDSEFNKTMSSLVTSTLYLKNAFGTLAKPLLETVIPVIVEIIDYIVEAINKLNAFIAALKGEDTYVAAKKHLVDYKESLDSANKSAKKLKNTLLGFDEINRLDDKTGASSAGADYNDMFETRRVDKTLNKDELDFAESLKMTIDDVFFDWDDLNGEQIAQKIITGLGGVLGGVIGFMLGGVPGAIIGSVAGVGLGLIISALTFNHDGRLSKEEIASMILGAVGAITGGILGGVIGGPLGALIGIAVGAFIEFLISSLIFKNDNHLTKDEILKMLGLALGIVLGPGMMIPLIIDFEIQAFNKFIKNSEKIQNALAKIHDWFDKVKDNAKKVISDVYNAIKPVTDWIWERQKVIYDAIYTHLNTLYQHFKDIFDGIAIAMKEIWDKVTEITDKIKEIINAVAQYLWDEKIKPFIDNVVKGATYLWNEIKKVLSPITNWINSNVISPLADKFAKFHDKIWGWFKDVGQKIANWMGNAIKGAINNVFTSIENTFNGFINNLNRAINWINSKLHTNITPVQPFRITRLKITQYASGGFPEDGLFMANHGELVGQFANGRTAVANNQQIEAGIEEAAYRGFMRAMQGQGGSTTFIAQLNGKTIFEEVVRQNNNATKTYGSSPLTAF